MIKEGLNMSNFANQSTRFHSKVTDKYSYLGAAHSVAIEELYQQYKQDPESIDFGWQKFFEGFEFQSLTFSPEMEVSEDMIKEFKVLNLIQGYRSRGHLFTKTNPVRKRRAYIPNLDIENFGLSEKDLDIIFNAGNEVSIGSATLRKIIDHLDETYCQSIGIEFMYIRRPERLNWIRSKIELENRPTFNPEEKKRIFNKLSEATTFEHFLQKKFVGQKRFSIEGGEALIPALDAIVQSGANMGVKEIVMGMAHRGRLNTLAHIFGKPYEHIFNEFAGKDYDCENVFDGDVKYHLGHSAEVVAENGENVHLTICPNPSHLEAVDSVVEGLTRSKIDSYLESEDKIVPILVHGDAAIAGQGVTYEMIQMALLDGYRTGGTIHLVVNNQIGFTTNYLDGRSSTYCTDVSKATLCPVFHVNADDVEAVIQTVKIALEYRQKFHRDVFIDLLGYRKYGHNEGDEPKFTQPKLYKAISKHANPTEIYGNQLISEGIFDQAYADASEERLMNALEKSFEKSKELPNAFVMNFLESTWKGYRPAIDKDFLKSPKTAYDLGKLKKLAIKVATLPKDLKFFRKVEKLMRDRLQMVENDSLDWGMGEMLAYATLLDEGHNIRISGQDVERGTFSHRHAVLKTEDEEVEYIPLNNLSKKQGALSIYNSLLSEYGVLGFDYGYAYGCPNCLTIWEAQFGDFNNGAQIIIDQFISAAEDKWRTQNGIVMLLPHGYEGMGSEHSSGRMERYLQLCAENNMVICNCTTPANFYHLLRRQVKWPFRKPLIVFTPKKLLRYPGAKSKIEEFTKGGFQEVIDDVLVDQKGVDTVVFCNGKIYYEILEEKEKKALGGNIAVVRVEQLYPFPENQVLDILEKYGKRSKYLWVQEEPENMGAWTFILSTFKKMRFDLIARPASSSPAAGSPRIFEHRRKVLMDKLFSYAK